MAFVEEVLDLLVWVRAHWNYLKGKGPRPEPRDYDVSG
jgi:hypothetical protein